MILKVFTDGGSKGNPGPSSIGGVGYIDGKKVFDFKKSIGIATNNDAEYQALIEALEKIRSTNIEIRNNSQNLNFKNVKQIQFFSDSRLMVNQVKGLFKVKNGRIKEYILIIRGLEQEINLPITYQYVPREENVEADKLVNQIYL
ncbi:ribonuclease H [Candidatus Roizmanbacteria bacterium CG_4_9_14_3_um_filter_33_18]|uniref:Ribonuclease H n=3 Tax=Candidatus Roizmaniibacteriota TaxID=1752723 RepID=A0A2M7UAP9_9BACT|nr:MAG: ribonuclease H [Candidatus Roizmanbacteria bacterium CG22_combo_CG10-13_8_21_14_all_34_12]PIZ68315.1 MAG: ribonuclease H [Candidatus Roizmanbacteria bacterium CG_4_10_14_0_2_um_filter_33_96]PJA55261.1 MAG: ribonuclease H [Candidatus Roizmanbacteria bacterium CG_4_9_14_3_um_filter_33_18]